MGNDVQEFDLHMEVGTSWYCGDASITCEVTYPSMSDQPPIKVDYDKGDESLEGAIARAIKDIEAYMNGPEEWVSDYIKHSSEDWRKLKQEQDYIEEYRAKIASDQKSIAYHQKYLAQHEEIAAALQAKLAQDA